MIVHLVCSRQPNDPGILENHIAAAIRALGHSLIFTDYRQDISRLPELLAQDAALILFSNAEGIDPHLIESCPCITALWHSEPICPEESYDEAIRTRRNEMVLNIHAFDYIFVAGRHHISVYQRMGAERVIPLSITAVDPSRKREPTAFSETDVVIHGLRIILDTVDFSQNRRIWPAYVLGVPTNRQGQPTRRLDRFNARVHDLLEQAGIKIMTESREQLDSPTI